MKRRQLFTLVAATAGFAVLRGIAQAREGIDTGLDADSAGDLAYLEGAFERHRGGYNGRAPDAVLGEMREDLALLAAALRRPHPARDRTDLARTAAGISGLVERVDTKIKAVREAEAEIARRRPPRSRRGGGASTASASSDSRPASTPATAPRDPALAPSPGTWPWKCCVPCPP
ncbi:hypothetical protein [Streptomyces sp. NPDC086989]|uniref:hypothetical protein n=1 Tax=Streptomyces sp. NPDC086989 TaxID=3365764 RepID=UPI003822E7FD